MNGKIAAIAITLIVAVPILMGYALSFEEETYESYESTQTDNVTDLINNYNEPIYSKYTGSSNNQALWASVRWNGTSVYQPSLVSPKYLSVGDKPTPLPIMAAESKTITVTYNEGFFNIPDTQFTWNADGNISFQLTKDDGTTNLVHPLSGADVVRYGSVFMFGNAEYDNVKTVDAKSLALSTNSITINTITDGTQYGDPAYGWSPVPYVSGWMAVEDVYWMNGYTNKSIRMMASFSNNEGVSLTPVSSNGTVQTPEYYISYTAADGLVIETDDDSWKLGDYTKAVIDIGTDSIRISGAFAWPTLGSDPQTYNSITLPYDAPIDNITKILIDGTSTVDLRVDSAQVLTGYFPAIRNSNFSVGGYYPEQTVIVSFSAVAAYGDEFGWGGQIWQVENGALVSTDPEINGLRVKDLVLMEEYVDADNPYYNFYINNKLISNFQQGSLIWFGGDWSLVVKVSQMENVESTRLVWQSGEWAWDGVGTDFALIGLLTCGAVFVGLGMYGRRSGAKVGVLMLITGCAAFIFLAMI